MKTTLAILFSLLLPWVQSVSSCLAMAASGPAYNPCCDPCACAVSCCVESSEPDRQQPAAPPPTTSKVQWQLIQVLCCALLEVPAIEQSKISPKAALADSSVAVPIYIRHCAYLI